ncbi:YdcF family protein [Pseudarthrobacter sp. J47]|uniref:YdcF family protein n=1 Tax=Pseudarthrobacter sp. J47 TaxID=3116482 RepID=UPI002E80B2D1|nr:YdcF family protein [Pseudarthrobacter sp. J47]MEE2524052.1 YdcF family protein [Pseudarthrobacter sp. J47]
MHQKRTAAARALAYSLSGLLTLWFIASIFVFCLNTPGPTVEPVEAVVVLGGSSAERLPVAELMADYGQAPVLVLSRTDTPGNASADALCRDASFPNPSLVCFRPVGMDTRGEAVAIAGLIRTNGWGSIAVVTSSYHVARAGTLMGQCTDVSVAMVASEPDLDSLQWLRRFVIETGGLLDVNLRPECGSQAG